jgi:hypothetical protein
MIVVTPVLTGLGKRERDNMVGFTTRAAWDEARDDLVIALINSAPIAKQLTLRDAVRVLGGGTFNDNGVMEKDEGHGVYSLTVRLAQLGPAERLKTKIESFGSPLITNVEVKPGERLDHRVCTVVITFAPRPEAA